MKVTKMEFSRAFRRALRQHDSAASAYMSDLRKRPFISLEDKKRTLLRAESVRTLQRLHYLGIAPL